jgi:hypothetical protein
LKLSFENGNTQEMGKLSHWFSYRSTVFDQTLQPNLTQTKKFQKYKEVLLQSLKLVWTIYSRFAKLVPQCDALPLCSRNSKFT